jgi:hypothetical protein
MINKNTRIWIWLQENELFKAVYNPADGTLIVTNERDEIILKRTGIASEQLKRLEELFLTIGAKRMDGNKEPFTYL